MSQNLANAITSIQTSIAGLTGIKSAPTTPPAQLSDFPAVVAYEGQGSWEFKEMGAMQWGLLSIVVELHFPRTLWDYAFVTLNSYADQIPKTIAKSMYDTSIGGTINNYKSIRVMGVIPMKWGDIDTLGYKFIVEGILIKQDISV